ncbi:MAG: HD domain-containing protein [Coriobacteriia bacterium]|nr:HD domain-containing protein [Coriobacteriia bacterium]
MSDEGHDLPDSRDHIALLLDVGLQLAESLELETVLQVAIEGAVRVLGQSTGAIYLVDDGGLVLGATVPALPPGHAHLIGPVPRADHPHIAEALETQQPVFVPDLAAVELTPGERAAVEGRGLNSVLYVPVIARARSEAVLIVGSPDVHPGFTEQQVALCKMLSAEIGYAVANARLYLAVESAARELRGAYDATLAGWSRALEMRDRETSGHTDRSAALAVELARRLGIPSCDLDNVRRGALLHDIGKMAVPDRILHKPGPLDEDEWVVMRKHPEFAYELLRGIGYLSSALDIPYCHHERWDGAGYPRGLCGEEIPLCARIFSVIDVYDALTSDRPYRNAWTAEDALDYIAAEAGVQFDPDVVGAFLEYVGTAGYVAS